MQDAKSAKVITPNEVSKIVVDAGIRVHTALGPGLLEEAYKISLKHELQTRNISVLSEVGMPVVYKEVVLDVG